MYLLPLRQNWVANGNNILEVASKKTSVMVYKNTLYQKKFPSGKFLICLSIIINNIWTKMNSAHSRIIKYKQEYTALSRHMYAIFE